MYFDIFNTPDQVKQRYRRLAKLFHPDVGGDPELMKELTFYYDKWIQEYNILDKENEKIEEMPSEEYDREEYKDKIEKILQFAEYKKSFDCTFINRMADIYDEGEDFSESQRESIDRIFSSFRVEERLEEYKKKKKA